MATYIKVKTNVLLAFPGENVTFSKLREIQV